jgi:hypothetical protein
MMVEMMVEGSQLHEATRDVVSDGRRRGIVGFIISIDKTSEEGRYTSWPPAIY